MGNCIETCRREEEDHDDHGDNDGEADVSGVEESGMFNKEGAMRIKIVLTREELQWLMLQLNNGNKQGEKRLEEALEEIERARSEKKLGHKVEERRTVWKPVLDSIMEVPEVYDQMNR